MNTKKEPWRVEVGRQGGIRSGEVRRAKAHERQIKEGLEIAAEEILMKRAPETLILRQIINEQWSKNISCTDVLTLLNSLLPRLQALSTIEGFQLRDLFKPPNSEPESRKHPFSDHPYRD